MVVYRKGTRPAYHDGRPLLCQGWGWFALGLLWPHPSYAQRYQARFWANVWLWASVHLGTIWDSDFGSQIL